MRKVLYVIGILMLWAVILYAQATNIRSGSTLPTGCRVGDIYIKTGTGAGLYGCAATNVWQGPYGETCVVSTSTQATGANDTTEDNDDTLLFAADASSTYQFHGIGFFSSGTDIDPDVKVTFAIPASASYTFAVDGFATGATTAADGHHSGGFTTSGVGTGFAIGIVSTAQMPQSPVWFHGILVTAGSSGNFNFMWAQNAADTTVVTRGVRSYLCWKKL